MSEEQPSEPSPPPSDAPHQAPPVEPPQPSPVDFGTQDSYAGDTAPLNFGEQTFIRSGLPGDLQARVHEPDAAK